MPWPAVALLGPTAAGKTALAFALADRYPVHLISVDATLVYRGLAIGAAQPTAAELAAYPHELIDIRDPADPYSAADFLTDARAAMARAREAGRIPLLVGGTMLYFRALQEGLAALPQARPAFRAALEERLAREGLPALIESLRSQDPEAARRIDLKNPRRVLRALEIMDASGERASVLWDRPVVRPLDADGFSLQCFGLWPEDRGALHARIETRFDAMIAAGWIEEVAALHARGDLSPALPALRAVGYPQWLAHLSGELSFDAARAAGLAATRQLARRQLTWLRGWAGLQRLPLGRDFALPSGSSLAKAFPRP
jgi:tRNA dimethylallyltransferase